MAACHARNCKVPCLSCLSLPLMAVATRWPRPTAWPHFAAHGTWPKDKHMKLPSAVRSKRRTRTKTAAAAANVFLSGGVAGCGSAAGSAGSGSWRFSNDLCADAAPSRRFTSTNGDWQRRYADRPEVSCDRQTTSSSARVLKVLCVVTSSYTLLASGKAVRSLERML